MVGTRTTGVGMISAGVGVGAEIGGMTYAIVSAGVLTTAIESGADTGIGAGNDACTGAVTGIVLRLGVDVITIGG